MSRTLISRRGGEGADERRGALSRRATPRCSLCGRRARLVAAKTLRPGARLRRGSRAVGLAAGRRNRRARLRRTRASRSSCRSACPGSARVSMSMRCRRSFSSSSNLAAAAASLYALGYGRHEHDPERVLPFFPAFLAGMNLVLVAADAYTFLLSWEFMSLASWALVMAHHREDQNARAGYVYLVMASFGTLSLLVAFALARRPRRALRLRGHARRPPSAGAGDPRLRRRADRRRLQGRPRAVARLAAARPSRGAQPCVGADERGDDQGRRLRLHPRRLRSRRSARLAAQRSRC